MSGSASSCGPTLQQSLPLELSELFQSETLILALMIRLSEPRDCAALASVNRLCHAVSLKQRLRSAFAAATLNPYASYFLVVPQLHAPDISQLVFVSDLDPSAVCLSAIADQTALLEAVNGILALFEPRLASSARIIHASHLSTSRLLPSSLLVLLPSSSSPTSTSSAHHWHSLYLHLLTLQSRALELADHLVAVLSASPATPFCPPLWLSSRTYLPFSGIKVVMPSVSAPNHPEILSAILQRFVALGAVKAKL